MLGRILKPTFEQAVQRAAWRRFNPTGDSLITHEARIRQISAAMAPFQALTCYIFRLLNGVLVAHHLDLGQKIIRLFLVEEVAVVANEAAVGHAPAVGPALHVKRGCSGVGVRVTLTGACSHFNFMVAKDWVIAAGPLNRPGTDTTEMGHRVDRNR